MIEQNGLPDRENVPRGPPVQRFSFLHLRDGQTRQYPAKCALAQARR
jgi:hypothetical protein